MEPKSEHVIIVSNKQALSFFCALTIILIVLKIMGYNVEWFWIIAAFFGPIILLGSIVIGMAVIMVSCFILALIIDYYESVQSKKRRIEHFNKMNREYKERMEKRKNDG